MEAAAARTATFLILPTQVEAAVQEAAKAVEAIMLMQTAGREVTLTQ